MRKLFLWIGGIAAAITLYNLDAITGQWKFERLCKEEGGPRFYAPVEKDVGWEVEARDTYSYESPFLFGHIKFVRYQDKNGVRSDVREAKESTPYSRKYVFSPVDEAEKVRYRITYVSAFFTDDERFSKTQYQVIDLATQQVVARHTVFGYRWTKPERVLLAAPTGVACWDTQADIDKFRQTIYAPRTTK